MFSIPMKKKPIKYRNSQKSIKQKTFPQNERSENSKFNISTDKNNITKKWNSPQKNSHSLRIFPQTQHQFINRQGQMRQNNRSIHIERKTVCRTLKNQQFSSYYVSFSQILRNNSDRVAEILASRKNWIRCLSPNYSPQIDFYWGAFNKIVSNGKSIRLSNRISGSYELTDKGRLYHNIVNYCGKNKINNEKFLPVTFCFTSRQIKAQIQQSVGQFLDYFEYIQSHTSLTNSWIMKPTNLNRGRDIFLFNSLDKLLNLLCVERSYNYNFSIKSFSTKLLNYENGNQFQSSKNDNYNYRLIQQIRPKTNFNRNSFNRFKNISSIKKTLPMPQINSENHLTTIKNSIYKSRKTAQFNTKIVAKSFISRQKSHKLKTQVMGHLQEIDYKNKKRPNHIKQKSQKIQYFDRDEQNLEKGQIQEKLCQVITNFMQGKSNYGQKMLKRQIVIQKYIENPFLINGNKFDIRIWVLVDHEFNFYIFKSGYLRFSSEKYKLDEKSIENNFIHLTNHAVQKFSENYEKDSNIVKMSYLREYLRQKQNYPKSIYKSPDQKYEQIEKEMERIIAISLQATLGTFYRQQHNRQKYDSNSQFELFGYDFLLDRELKVRLIEANCNPSITQDNLYLEQAVPRMLNDLFKLTVDKVNFPKYKGQIFFMDGFGLQNLWKKLGKIGQIDLKSIRNSFQ